MPSDLIHKTRVGQAQLIEPVKRIYQKQIKYLMALKYTNCFIEDRTKITRLCYNFRFRQLNVIAFK